MGHGGSALLFPITCLVSFITKWHLSVGRPWSVLRSTGTLAWPRGTGPFFPAPGPLAHWPGSLALIGSFAHWLIGTGLASISWPYLFIASSAHWRRPNWLIGSLAQASFLAYLELFCSGLRTLESQGYLTSSCSRRRLGS